MRKVMIALGISLLISGCAHKRQPEVITVVETRTVTIPEQLLSCMPEPEAREVWRSQKDVALYLIKISEAGEDCRAKLAGVRRLVESE